MPNTREKLIELLDGVQDYGFFRSTVEEPQGRVINSIIADFLIANGVTVQEWISVKDRLPEEDVRVLVRVDPNSKWNTEVELDTDRRHKNRWVRWGEAITHWMPLPEPPKEK